MSAFLAQSFAWPEVGILVAVAILAAAMGAVLGWRSRGNAPADGWNEDRQEQLARQFSDQVRDLSATIHLLQERLSRLEQQAQPAGPLPASGTVPSDADPLTQRIYELADQGVTPVAIAQQLHEHTGTVELILALRRQISGRADSAEQERA